MSGIMNMFVATKTTIATAVDAFFNSVSLLLNTSSTNGAQNNTFLDSSSSPLTITRNGNVTQGTFTPFSQTGWSNYFNGSSYLQNSTSAPLATTASTFTIEAWVYMTAAPTNGTSNRVSVIADANPTGSTMYWGFGVNSSQQISFFWYASGDNSVTGNTTISLNAWHHIAMSVSSNAISMYVDGVQQTLSGTTTLTNRSGTTFGDTGVAFELGYWNNATAVFTGYMSNVRIVSGTAVYSGSSFTPPTTPLTAISGTSVLTCQSNRFVDNSTNAYPFTIGGTPSVQAFSPFLPTAAYDAAVVGGSGYFDGSGDYLSIAAQTALNFGTGDFTLEAWVYPTTTLGDAMCIFSSVSSGGLMFGTNGAAGSGVWALGRRGVSWDYSSSAVPSLNQWQHVAISRSGTSVRIFINGVQSGTTGTNSTSYDLSSGGTLIGYQVSYMNGYFCGVRATNSALYTSNFTPPTAPPTAITNTQLLLNYTNSGIYDSASKNVLETVGNAQVSTTQAKWGTTAMYFDGSGDLLLIPNNQMFNLNADFTIEFWIYLNSTSGEQCIFHNHNSDNNGVFVSVNGGGAGKIRLGAGNGSSFYVLIDSSTAISASTWAYVACTRSGSTWTVYINGSSAGTATSSSNPTFSTSDLIQIGRFTSGAPNALNAYIDDLRITKYARTITASPTAAFPLN